MRIKTREYVKHKKYCVPFFSCAWRCSSMFSCMNKSNNPKKISLKRPPRSLTMYRYLLQPSHSLRRDPVSYSSRLLGCGARCSALARRRLSGDLFGMESSRGPRGHLCDTSVRSQRAAGLACEPRELISLWARLWIYFAAANIYIFISLNMRKLEHL